ncbi:hypothetical protein AMJ49_07140 [Parcubacteria bacterium DG_74_2]|nr:MAG: hypothetical protein AMJ49_07140 [Parcubacteria bacterium DG_74_2]
MCLPEFEEELVDEETAREIMEGNFIGTKQAAKHFDIKIDQKKIPFSEEVLRQHKTSHILFFAGSSNNKGKSLNINYFARTFPEIFSKPKWYSKENFASFSCKAGWYLIKKNYLNNSNQDQQKKSYVQLKQEFLHRDEYIEKAVIYIYAMVLVFKAQKEKLFGNNCIWCESRDSQSRQVFVGWRSGKIYISSWWELFDPNRNIVIAPVKKPTFF